MNLLQRPYKPVTLEIEEFSGRNRKYGVSCIALHVPDFLFQEELQKNRINTAMNTFMGIWNLTAGTWEDTFHLTVWEIAHGLLPSGSSPPLRWESGSLSTYGLNNVPTQQIILVAWEGYERHRLPDSPSLARYQKPHLSWSEDAPSWSNAMTTAARRLSTRTSAYYRSGIQRSSK